jgi:hypothetical protein
MGLVHGVDDHFAFVSLPLPARLRSALTSKHHWLIINCDSCGTVVDLDLRMKPRDPEASIRVVLREVQCPRCNGHGRPRIISLARQPSV